MRTRAYRARLSLTPDELEAVHAQIDAAWAESETGTEGHAFWSKLLDKVENAMERAPGGRYLRSPQSPEEEGTGK